MAAIELHGLTNDSASLTAVDDVSFTVDHGSVIGFLGPTAPARPPPCACSWAWSRPTAGTATINGHPDPRPPDPAHLVGAALESSGAYPGRTAPQSPARAGHGRRGRAQVPGRGGPGPRRPDRAPPPPGRQVLARACASG